MNLCLGTVQFGLNYGIQGNHRLQEDKIFEILSFAIDNDIDIFDTASAYGEAEKILGDYFRKYPENAKKIGIVSKLKPDVFPVKETDKWAEIAVQNAKNSLEIIGIDKFFAYLFHNSSYIFNEKAVEALNEVKKSGLADRIGVSVYTPEEAMKALEYSCIGAIQIPYNVFDHRLDKCGFFEKAKKQGVLVFARSSLLQGLIMMEPDYLPERVAFARGYLAQFLDICRNYGISPFNAAVGYVGKKQGIDYVVFGVDNLSQLNDFISMKSISFPHKMLQEIDNAFENVEEKLVNPSQWKIGVNMKYLVMIQARCGSTRLPNKVLKDLFGKTVLERMIERVRMSTKVDEVMVVTSIEKNNLPILKLCSELDVRVGIGSEDDVLDRFYQVAKLLKPEYVIRLTADCPCFDAQLLDQAITKLNPDSDYMAMISETFADGLDLEIIKYSALEKAWRESVHSFEREHVTQYIVRRPEKFKLQDFESPVGYFGDCRWTVDQPEDFEVVKLIYKHFLNTDLGDKFSYKDILSFMEEHPEIKEINKKYSRNEGLKKSIQEDRVVDNTNM